MPDQENSRNVRIHWEHPRDANGDIYDKLAGYEIHHNLPGFASPYICDPSVNSSDTFSLPEGIFSVGIAAVNTEGHKSKKVIHNFEVSNVIQHPEVTRDYNVPLGGTISTDSYINSSTGIFRTEAGTGWSFASAGSPRNFTTFQNGHANRYSQDCSDIASLDFSSMPPHEQTIQQHYIFFDYSDSDDPLKLIKYEDVVHSTSNNLNVGYFYDSGDGDVTPESTFVTKTGTASVAVGSNDVVGTGTSFTTEYALDDIIYFSSTRAAKITFISSNTSLTIDRAFDAAITNSTIKVQGYTPDFNFDAVLYAVRNDQGTFIIFPSDLTIDPDVFSRSRVATLQSAPSLLNFNGSEVLTTTYTSDPQKLTLTATGNGFLSPKFKITGTGFNNSEISQAAHSSFQDPTSGKTFVYPLDKVDAFVTTDLDFTVTITEASDESNTDLQFTQSVTIPFIKDGDDSSATAKQNANGYLYYNTQQAGAPSAPSNSSVTYTFSSGVMSGGVIGTGSTNWSLTAPAATGGTSGSKMYYIYWVAEEATAGTGSATPDFDSTVYTATNFTGLVRFNGTNQVEDGVGGSLSFGSSGTTTIDGGKITTGTVAASRISIAGKSNSDLVNNEGFTDDTVANTKTTAAAAAAAANAAAKVAGSVGGWGISSSYIQGGSGVYIASAKTAYGQDTAGFWLGNVGSTPKFDIGTNSKYLRWDGSSLNIKGNITLDNAASISLAGFSNSSTGFTNDTAADAAQATADTKTTAAAALAASNAATKTAGKVGGWTISSSYIQGGQGVYIAGGKDAYSSNTAGWWIGQASGSDVAKLNIGDATTYLKWSGTGLEIKGNVILDNAAAISLSSFINDDGWTDNTVANTKTTAAEAATASNTQEKVLGKIGGWSIDSTTIFSGTKDTTDYTAGGITFNSGGSIHAKEFYIDTDGNAKFKGQLEAASGTFSGDISAASGTFTGTVKIGTVALNATNTLNENTTKANVGLANITNPNSLLTPLGEGAAAVDINSHSTTISGGKITTGTLTAEKIESGNNTIGTSNDKFAFSGATEISGYSCVIGSLSGTSSRFAGLFFGQGGVEALGAQSAGTAGAGLFVNSPSIGSTTADVEARLATSTWGGTFLHTDSGNWIKLASTDWAAQWYGSAGTFTGAHDGLLTDSETCIEGDIMVDSSMAHKASVSDTLTNVTRSTSANQKSVIGVFVKELSSDYTPSALSKLDSTGLGTKTILDPSLSALLDNKNPIAINSLGEGQVNVCGENGDIEIGDLIVSSSTTGKGMKQDDDIVRSCTVGKAREAITFASASSIAQIACIYMCG